jgi:CDP-diacylglycerol---serine O-phosphatidyltransferase
LTAIRIAFAKDNDKIPTSLIFINFALMNIIKHIPNAITCGNLFCGCLAIVCAFNGNLIGSAYLVGLAAILDFFDGFAARMLKVSGEIGKQLDSLADMVTFGVVPGVIMFQLIKMSIFNFALSGDSAINTENKVGMLSVAPVLPYVAFIITIFSCIRLAKFNTDTRQSESFIGVPTPANSILICSIPLILYYHYDFTFLGSMHSPDMMNNFSENDAFIVQLLINPYFLIVLTFLMSFLLIAELPLFALKFKNFKWRGNRIRYSFLITSLILLILFHFIAIPFIIFLYIVMSIVSRTKKV